MIVLRVDLYESDEVRTRRQAGDAPLFTSCVGVEPAEFGGNLHEALRAALQVVNQHLGSRCEFLGQQPNPPVALAAHGQKLVYAVRNGGGEEQRGAAVKAPALAVQ